MIAIEELGNGRWRWSFRERTRNIELVSNEDYEDAAAARAAAEIAYPGVPIEEPGRAGTKPRRRGAGSRRTAAPRPAADGGITGKLARKVAEWLTPVVILIAWGRSKRRRP